jgi:hypothetical protein
MLSTLFLAFAAQAAAAGMPESTVLLRELYQGPMPAENIWLRPAHAGSDERMFPDIAIGELRIDGDTVYVRVLNKGRSATPGPVLVAARVDENGSKSGTVEQRTAKLLANEARWVPLRGFSVKIAASVPTVFALESATSVAAVAHMLPSSTGVLDRSGQTRNADTTDLDESNNALTATGSALKHGRPQ